MAFFVPKFNRYRKVFFFFYSPICFSLAFIKKVEVLIEDKRFKLKSILLNDLNPLSHHSAIYFQQISNEPKTMDKNERPE